MAGAIRMCNLQPFDFTRDLTGKKIRLGQANPQTLFVVDKMADRI